MRAERLLACVASLAIFADAAAQVTLTEGTNFTIDASSDQRLAIDLLGSIWVLPAAGGAAEPVTSGLLPARRPRWSPDNQAILFEAQATERNELRIFRFDEGKAVPVGSGPHSDQFASWHPDGERIVFSSDRRDSGLDLWELDVPTGLAWRITSRPGDESDATWSADGRSLAYISKTGDQWHLVVRRFGEPDRVLISSDEQISAPSWRPDGSLITFARHSEDGLAISMLILSEPLLERTLIDEDDLFLAPVTWLDRQRMLYPAKGLIRSREFNSWISRTVPFRATIGSPGTQSARRNSVRELPMLDEPGSRIVIRAARLFDGIGGGYQLEKDLVVEGGRIAAIEDRRDRSGEIVFDMGDLTVLPGFIDGYASLPEDTDMWLGPVLLTFGVTTVIAESEQADELTQHWSGGQVPGPRVLAAAPVSAENDAAPWLVTLSGDMNAGLQQRDLVDDWQDRGVPVLAETWQAGIGSGAALLLGGTTLPASPGGHRYQDMDLASGGAPVTIVSGLADAQTPGLEPLLASRQAGLLPRVSEPVRRYAAPPRLSAESTTVVLGSKPSGLAPGIALHARVSGAGGGRALGRTGLACCRRQRGCRTGPGGCRSGALRRAVSRTS